MKVLLLLPIICEVLFCSTNGAIIDGMYRSFVSVFFFTQNKIIFWFIFSEKEIFEKFSTDLQKLKELVAERKAEYDSNTNNVSVFHGIKYFRTSGGYSSLFRTKTNVTLGHLLSNYTSYAVNDEDHEQEIEVINETLEILSVNNVTRGISPDLIYESWNIDRNNFTNWRDVNVTVVLEKQHTTSYSVTNETHESLLLTSRRPSKVIVPPHSKKRVTTTIYSGLKTMVFALEVNLAIRSEDYETSFSDDELKTGALEFFDSNYWKKSTENFGDLNIIKTDDGIALQNFPFVVKRTKINVKSDVGEAEPL